MPHPSGCGGGGQRVRGATGTARRRKPTWPTLAALASARPGQTSGRLRRGRTHGETRRRRATPPRPLWFGPRAIPGAAAPSRRFHVVCRRAQVVGEACCCRTAGSTAGASRCGWYVQVHGRWPATRPPGSSSPIRRGLAESEAQRLGEAWPATPATVDVVGAVRGPTGGKAAGCGTACACLWPQSAWCSCRRWRRRTETLRPSLCDGPDRRHAPLARGADCRRVHSLCAKAAVRCVEGLAAHRQPEVVHSSASASAALRAAAVEGSPLSGSADLGHGAPPRRRRGPAARLSGRRWHGRGKPAARECVQVCVRFLTCVGAGETSGDERLDLREVQGLGGRAPRAPPGAAACSVGRRLRGVGEAPLTGPRPLLGPAVRRGGHGEACASAALLSDQGLATGWPQAWRWRDLHTNFLQLTSDWRRVLNRWAGPLQSSLGPLPRHVSLPLLSLPALRSSKPRVPLPPVGVVPAALPRSAALLSARAAGRRVAPLGRAGGGTSATTGTAPAGGWWPPSSQRRWPRRPGAGCRGGAARDGGRARGREGHGHGASRGRCQRRRRCRCRGERKCRGHQWRDRGSCCGTPRRGDRWGEAASGHGCGRRQQHLVIACACKRFLLRLRPWLTASSSLHRRQRWRFHDALLTRSLCPTKKLGSVQVRRLGHTDVARRRERQGCRCRLPRDKRHGHGFSCGHPGRPGKHRSSCCLGCRCRWRRCSICCRLHQ